MTSTAPDPAGHYRRLVRVLGGFPRAYVYGALGGLVGMLAAGMLADWVLPSVCNIGLAGFRASVLGWLFLGGLVTLEQIQIKAEAQVKAEDEG